MDGIPSDVRLALETNPLVKEKWDALTVVGQHDFLSWLKSAKKTDTRALRIVKMCDMLAKGKRRPCCYSVVPLGLYKALNANSKAKAQWSQLSAAEKRVFLDWIEISIGKEQKSRIDEACSLIAKGKKEIG